MAGTWSTSPSLKSYAYLFLSWLMTSAIGFDPLTTLLQPLRMCRMTCVWGGAKFPTYFKYLSPIFLFTLQRLRLCNRDKSSYPPNHECCGEWSAKCYRGRCRRRRFHISGFKIWRFSIILSNFSNSFTAHAQKLLPRSFRWKFWHWHWIRWPRFPYWVRYFGDLRTFSVDSVIV